MADQAAAGQKPEDNLNDILDAQVELLSSPDFIEAVSARLEKRNPVFSGR
jgi:enoyl-CoA hydratase/carnithine racemase